MSESPNYFDMTPQDQEKTLRNLYEDLQWSWPMVAEHLSTYTNRVARDAKKFGIATRTKAESQKVALEQERTQHPTKGKTRSVEEKAKIGKTAANRWKNMSEDEREKMCKMSRDKWAAMTTEQKEAFQRASIEAIQKSAKEGSKLEKFLHKELIRAGYEVHFHKHRLIRNEQLEIDILVPKMGICIEVDGPSHWSPIWGDEAYERVQRSDKQKTGLIIGAGFTLIRVEQHKNLSLTYKNELLSSLLKTLKQIESGTCKDKLIYLGRE